MPDFRPKKVQVTCRWAQFNILPNVLGQIESDSFLKRLPHSLSNCSVPRLTSRLPKPRTSSLVPGLRNVQEKNWASWPPQRMLVCRIPAGLMEDISSFLAISKCLNQKTCTHNVGSRRTRLENFEYQSCANLLRKTESSRASSRLLLPR